MRRRKAPYPPDKTALSPAYPSFTLGDEKRAHGGGDRLALEQPVFPAASSSELRNCQEGDPPASFLAPAARKPATLLGDIAPSFALPAAAARGTTRA